MAEGIRVNIRETVRKRSPRRKIRKCETYRKWDIHREDAPGQANSPIHSHVRKKGSSRLPITTDTVHQLLRQTSEESLQVRESPMDGLRGVVHA